MTYFAHTLKGKVGKLSQLSRFSLISNVRRLSTPTLGFDYVIVGAGSTGCVLASRLSENGPIELLCLKLAPKTILGQYKCLQH